MRSTPEGATGITQPKGPLSCHAHHRSRPRRVRRVGELGRRHRSAARRGPPRDRRRQPAARPRHRRRRRQRPGPHDRGAGRARRPLLRRRRDLERRPPTPARSPGSSTSTASRRSPARTASSSRACSPAACSARRRRGRSRAATERPTSTSLADRFHDMFCADVPAPQAALMAATQRPATQEALVEPSGERPLWKDAAVVVPDRRGGPHHPRRAAALHGQAGRRAPHDRDPGRLARGPRRAPRRDRPPDPRGRGAARGRLDLRTTTERTPPCPHRPRPRASCSSPPSQAFVEATASPPFLYELTPDEARKVLDDVQAAPDREAARRRSLDHRAGRGRRRPACASFARQAPRARCP